MPCRPGFTPVTAEVHAGGVYVGTVDIRVPDAPFALSAPRRGMTPASINGSKSRHATPSSPMATARLAMGRHPRVAPDLPHEAAGGGVVEISRFEDRVTTRPRLGGRGHEADCVGGRQSEVARMVGQPQPAKRSPKGSMIVTVESGRDDASERNLGPVKRSPSVHLVDSVRDLMLRSGGGSRRACADHRKSG